MKRGPARAEVTGATTTPVIALPDPAARVSVDVPPRSAGPAMPPMTIEDAPQDAPPRRRAVSAPEDGPPRRRAAWIAAALVGAGVCVVGALALQDRRAPAAETTATATPTTPTPAPPAPPAPAPAPPTTTPPTPPPAPPTLAPSAPAPSAPAPPPPARPPAASRAPAAPPSPPPTVVLRPPEVPSIAAPAPPPPTEAPVEDPATEVLAALYAAVGRSLKQLDDAIGKPSTIDLWSPYLRIHINEALGTRAQRIEAHQTLRHLEREIAHRAPQRR